MRLSFVSWVVLALSMTGCSGGGGGAGGGQSEERLTLDRQQIAVAVSRNGLQPSASLTGTVSGSPSAVYVFIQHTQNGLESVSQPIASGSSATSQLLFKPPATTGHGSFQDTITVRACRDAQCAQPFAGSPITVNVSYTVGLPASPDPVSIQTIEGVPAAAQDLSMSVYSGSASWATSITYTRGANWLAAQPGSGASLPMTTALSASALPAGDYVAQLGITATPASGSAEQRTVAVNYTVLSLLTTTTPARLDVTLQQPASGQFRDIAVTSRDATRPSQWSAATSADWLTVVTPTGTTASSAALRVQLNAGEVARLPNGVYDATIVVTPSLAGASAINVPVQLVLQRPHVDTVAPYIEKANVAREVVLRGSSLTDRAVTSIFFGAHDTIGFYQLRSTNEIRVTHPPLPPGRYPVVVNTPDGPIDSGAELVVKGSSNYPTSPTTQSSPHGGWTAFFDRERDTCFIASVGADHPIAAIKWNGTAWDVLESPRIYNNASEVRMTADGRELLAFLGADEIAHLDPVTLAEKRRSITSDAALGPSQSFGWRGSVVTANGTVLTVRGARYIRYQPATGIFLPHGEADGYDFDSFPSGAGNRIIWSRGRLSDLAFRIINTADGTVSTPFYTASGTISDIKGDRFGVRWAIAGEASHSNLDVTVLNANGTLRGTIPGSMSRGPIAMTPDGDTLYVGVGNTIQVFDISVNAPQNGAYTPTGTMNVSMVGNILSANEDAVISCRPGSVNAVALP